MPKLASSMASARRISGSASPSRLVACSNWARLLRRMRDARVVLAEVRLGDGERAAGSAVPPGRRSAFASKQHVQAGPSIARSARRSLPRRRVADHRLGMRRQRVRTGQVRTSCGLPVNAAFTQPSASVSRCCAVPACCQPAPRHVLHQPVHQECLGLRIARRQRVGRQIVQRGVRVLVPPRPAPARRAGIPAPVRGPGRPDAPADARAAGRSVGPPRSCQVSATAWW